MKKMVFEGNPHQFVTIHEKLEQMCCLLLQTVFFKGYEFNALARGAMPWTQFGRAERQFSLFLL